MRIPSPLLEMRTHPQDFLNSCDCRLNEADVRSIVRGRLAYMLAKVDSGDFATYELDIGIEDLQEWVRILEGLRRDMPF